MDSVGDASADDLLRFLYDLAFRQRSLWGWAVAVAFAAVPGWLALVSLIEGNYLSGVVFVAMCAIVPGLRYYLLRKIELSVLDGRTHTPDGMAQPFDVES